MNWTTHFLWNGAKKGALEDVAMFEITEFFQADISLFNADTDYKRLCYEAFETEEVTVENMSFALAQFFRTLTSGNSKYDRFIKFEEELSGLELMGLKLFNTEAGDCFHCHSVPMTTDQMFHNIGLDATFNETNSGRFLVTNDEADLGKFKTPTLRNVAKSSPYMHDGRFKTLKEVIEHYNTGVEHSATLDPIMSKPGKEFGLKLDDYDKYALELFLKTLTDTLYTNNPAHSDPF